MTIKSSGSSLSFSEIEAEFGANGLPDDLIVISVN